MNTIKFLKLLVLAIVFASCSNDDDNTPQNHAPVSEDMVVNMNENPTSDLVTVIEATDLDGDDLTYSIVSQTPSDSVSINSATGSIFVQDIDAFDYEQNTTITVVIAVSDGVIITEFLLTINILDVHEPG